MYLIYLNLLKDHYDGWILLSPKPAVPYFSNNIYIDLVTDFFMLFD